MSTVIKKESNKSLISCKSQDQLLVRKRIQSAKLTQILKHKMFKGYNKIKFINNKKFDLKTFLSNNPEDKYLPTSEKYNIYYENKYLKNKEEDSKYIPLKESLIINKPKNSRKIIPFSFLNSSNSSTTNFSLGKRIKSARLNNSSNYRMNNVNINESKKIFENENEKNICSKYPFLIFDKIPDNVYNPKNLRNFLHYKPKNRQKNKNQQKFLFSLSHHKEKQIKNIFKSFSQRTTIKNKKKKMFHNSREESDKYNLISFSCIKKENIKKDLANLQKLVNKMKKLKLKKFLIKEKFKKFFS